jgi:hypothetical protein
MSSHAMYSFTMATIDGMPVFRRADGVIVPVLMLVPAGITEGATFHVPAPCVDAAEGFLAQLAEANPTLMEDAGKALENISRAPGAAPSGGPSFLDKFELG